MPSYTDPFGGSTVNPAQVSYQALALTANVTLSWPSDSFGPTDPVFARLMDVTPSGAGFSITLPDARRESPGWDAFFSNQGASSYDVKSTGGATLTTVSPGQVRYLYLTGNSTAAGTWRNFGMGSLVSSIDSAALAGRGLAADGSVLRVAQLTSTFSSNYTVLAADLAKAFVWVGGAGSFTLPLVGGVGTDFFVSVANLGVGALTVTGTSGEMVDGATSFLLQPNESAIMHAGPTAWYSVGRGRSTQFNFSLLNKSVTGGSVVLTPSEASNVAHKYTGLLTSACEVTLPSVVQVYYVSNQTTGSFTLTFRTAGVGTTVTVPQGLNAVLLSDGLNIINASTTAAGISSLSMGSGSVGSPSLFFTADPTTGIYQPATGNFAITISGTQRVNVSATGIQVTGGATLSTTLAVSGAATLSSTLVVSGAVGVGTSPVAGRILHIKDVADTGLQGLRIEGNAGNFYDIARVAATGELRINGNQAGVPTLDVQANGVSRLYITASGNVGIGTSTPLGGSANLDVRGGGDTNIAITSSATAATTGLFIKPQGGGSAFIQRDAGFPLLFGTGSGAFGVTSVEHMRIDGSGNVTPGGNATQALGSSALRWSAVYTAQVSDGAEQLVGSSGTTSRFGYGTGWSALSLATAGTERVHVNATGVGIGVVPAAKFHVGVTSGDVTSRFTTTSVTVDLQASEGSLFGLLRTTTNHPLLFGTNSAERMRITAAGVIQDAAGLELGYKDVPQNTQAAGYTLVVGDRGKHINASAGVTVPASVFAAGAAVTIYNNTAGNITITQGTSVTLRHAGTANTGNRTLAQRGVATVLFITATEAVISGAGLT